MFPSKEKLYDINKKHSFWCILYSFPRLICVDVSIFFFYRGYRNIEIVDVFAQKLHKHQSVSLCLPISSIEIVIAQQRNNRRKRYAARNESFKLKYGLHRTITWVNTGFLRRCTPPGQVDKSHVITYTSQMARIPLDVYIAVQRWLFRCFSLSMSRTPVSHRYRTLNPRYTGILFDGVRGPKIYTGENAPRRETINKFQSHRTEEIRSSQ